MAEGSTATGVGSWALGESSTATGRDSLAAAYNASAFGAEASAGYANSTAIGAGAATTRANQVAIGTGSNTYTLAGLPSAASNAAQIGATNFVTTDSFGNLGTSMYGPDSIGALDGRVSALEGAIGQSQQEARQGIAAAMAMTTSPMPSAPGRTSWATNVATFRGEFAGGASFAHRFNTDFPLAITGGYAYGGGSNHGARLGLQGEF
jgi:autotransporter adhesin